MTQLPQGPDERSTPVPTRQANAERYEEIAQKLLDRFATDFGLDRVEGKQQVDGTVTSWELDGVAFLANNEGMFYVVECRRYTTSKLKQEALAAIAYRIHDTGALGGIVVSPMELQSGAERIAEAEDIINVRLNADATLTSFVMQLKGRAYVGLAETLPPFSENLAMKVMRAACSAGRHADCSGDCSCDCHAQPTTISA
jgi:hypothetical protein